MYDALETGVQRSDMWRYAALYMYGGVYADVDVVAKPRMATLLNSLPDNLNRSGVVFVESLPSPWLIGFIARFLYVTDMVRVPQVPPPTARHRHRRPPLATAPAAHCPPPAHAARRHCRRHPSARHPPARTAPHRTTAVRQCYASAPLPSAHAPPSRPLAPPSRPLAHSPAHSPHPAAHSPHPPAHSPPCMCALRAWWWCAVW